MRRLKSYLKSFAKPLGNFAVLILRLLGRSKLKVPEKYLVTAHLLRAGNPLHPNKAIFIKILSEFSHKPLQILETGTSAWGADSTRLWDEYVRVAGGRVLSADIRQEPSLILKGKVSQLTQFSVSDSVEFLTDLANNHFQADLIYLDSFDVDWDDPSPAEEHGGKEFEIAKTIVRVGGIILIDDTPTKDFAERLGISNSTEHHLDDPTVRGKGALALKMILNDPRFVIICHEYAVAIKRIS